MSTSADPINVLHVDDEPGFADMAATFLERKESRFSVETTTDASDGLERLADDGFDCVISDYDMPGKNGIEFLEDVREEDTDLPFPLFTGKGSEEIASDAISAGVTDYLQKEGSSDQYTILANRIQNVVEGARANREREQMRERMELALEETNSVIFEFDFEEGDVSRHGAVERFFETDTERISTFEDYIERVVHPDDRERFREFYRHLQMGDQDHDAIEYRTNPDHGSVRWFRDHTYVATDDDGDHTEYTGEQPTELNDQNREIDTTENESVVVGVPCISDWWYTPIHVRDSIKQPVQALLDGQAEKTELGVWREGGEWHCSFTVEYDEQRTGEETPIGVDAGHSYILAATPDDAGAESFLASRKEDKFERRYYRPLRDSLQKRVRFAHATTLARSPAAKTRITPSRNASSSTPDSSRIPSSNSRTSNTSGTEASGTASTRGRSTNFNSSSRTEPREKAFALRTSTPKTRAGGVAGVVNWPVVTGARSSARTVGTCGTRTRTRQKTSANERGTHARRNTRGDASRAAQHAGDRADRFAVARHVQVDRQR